jgi:hypothetical protein
MYYTPETLLNHVFEDLQKTKAPNMRYIDTTRQLIDILTKPLDKKLLFICEGNWVFVSLFLIRGLPFGLFFLFSSFTFFCILSAFHIEFHLYNC